MEMRSGGGGSDILVSCHSGGGGLKTRKCEVEVGGRTSRSVATQVEVVNCHSSGGGGLKTRKCEVEVGGRTSRSIATHQVEVA